MIKGGINYCKISHKRNRSNVKWNKLKKYIKNVYLHSVHARDFIIYTNKKWVFQMLVCNKKVEFKIVSVQLNTIPRQNYLFFLFYLSRKKLFWHLILFLSRVFKEIDYEINFVAVLGNLNAHSFRVSFEISIVHHYETLPLHSLYFEIWFVFLNIFILKTYLK